MEHLRDQSAKTEKMQPCNLGDLSGWLDTEISQVSVEFYRRVILEVNTNLSRFVKWPQRSLLLWDGCCRVPSHDFPPELRQAIRAQQLPVRNWSNDPAIYAYRLAGGERPKRTGGTEWSIHHLYDGKFPYPGGRQPSVQAVKHPRHFTQSAGLVAVHPIADALADEFAIFAWRLRAESFVRFGYDPESAFTAQSDGFGFAGQCCERFYIAPDSLEQARANKAG